MWWPTTVGSSKMILDQPYVVQNGSCHGAIFILLRAVPSCKGGAPPGLYLVSLKQRGKLKGTTSFAKEKPADRSHELF